MTPAEIVAFLKDRRAEYVQSDGHNDDLILKYDATIAWVENAELTMEAAVYERMESSNA